VVTLRNAPFCVQFVTAAEIRAEVLEAVARGARGVRLGGRVGGAASRIRSHSVACLG